MTVEDRERLKKGLPTWFTIANFIVLVTIVFRQAQWMESVDNRLAQVEKHAEDTNKHMPYNEKVQMFVPRSEMEIHMENMYKILNEIKVDIKQLERNR